MVEPAGADTQVGSRGVKVTPIPPAGAGVSAPALRNSVVNAAPKVLNAESVAAVMLSDAVVLTSDVSGAKFGLSATTAALPSATPLTVAFLSCSPTAKLTVGVTTDTFDGSRLVMFTTTPPAGAGSANCTGREAVCPNATFCVVGRVIRLSDPVTTRVSGSYPTANATISAVPAAIPVSTVVAVLLPSGMVALGGVTSTIDGELLTTLTVTMPT